MDLDYDNAETSLGTMSEILSYSGSFFIGVSLLVFLRFSRVYSDSAKEDLSLVI